MKKLISLLLAIALLVSCIPVGVLAADEAYQHGDRQKKTDKLFHVFPPLLIVSIPDSSASVHKSEIIILPEVVRSKQEIGPNSNFWRFRQVSPTVFEQHDETFRNPFSIRRKHEKIPQKPAFLREGYTI